jgi:hypothetical protein
MIEMRWTRLITDSQDYVAQNHRYQHAANVGGFACVLQFRDVIQRRENGDCEIATDWKDVEIAGKAI